LIAGGGVLFAIAEAGIAARHRALGDGPTSRCCAMIGAFLGWQLMLVTLVLSSFAGLPDWHRRHCAGPRRHEVPASVGTFLRVGALTAAVVGEPLVAW
jgi:prepilin signal peptidase PulO-like enzyme (type II secretory pathway)